MVVVYADFVKNLRVRRILNDVGFLYFVCFLAKKRKKKRKREKTTTTRINFYKVSRKLNDTANLPLSRVVALFYNRTLLEELRTFSETRQRTLQLKEADTLPDNGPINLS